MKIALFGGSFDPIHNGHRAAAQVFLQKLGLDRIIFMPTCIPPHKLRSWMAPAEDRLEMCRLALQDEPAFTVSDREIRRGDASFTVDTLDELRREWPAHTEWYLITGADMFLTLSTWYRFDRLKTMATLCAVPRDDADEAVLRAYAERLTADGARCIVADAPCVDVSSTEIRRRIAAGESTEGMLSPAVAAYIRKTGLYGDITSDSLSEQQVIAILKKRLKPDRLNHSLRVADAAEALAQKYGADPEKARFAGLLHDITKNTSGEIQLQMCEEFGILLSDVEKQSPPLWHAISGSGFVGHILGVRDPDVLNAIRYHTTARAGMSPLEKVVYLADFISADRDYDDVDVMRSLADHSMEEAMEYGLRYTIKDLVRRHRVLHPDTIGAYNEIISNKEAD